jgi:hypothetical protein
MLGNCVTIDMAKYLTVTTINFVSIGRLIKIQFTASTFRAIQDFDYQDNAGN